jgi:starch synthase
MDMKKHVVHIANEVAPYYKNGGLGDVVGALPQYLSREYKNTVVSFYYKGMMNHIENYISDDFYIEMQGVDYHFTYYYFRKFEVDYYFLNMEDEYVFCDYSYNVINGENPYKNFSSIIVFLFFGKAVLKLIQLKISTVTLLLCHDWHGAGIFGYPSILNEISTQFKTKIYSIILIHNYGYQGNVYEDVLPFLEEEPLALLKDIYSKFGSATLLSLAIEQANYVLTVSKNYAKELMEDILPHENIKFISSNKQKIIGLLNGVDYSIWHPKSSPYLTRNYDINSRESKLYYKKQIFEKCGFESKDIEKIPLILYMCRLTEQKGISLFFDTHDKSQKAAILFFKDFLNLGLKLIIYGTPSDGIKGEIHKSLTTISNVFRDSCYYSPEYNERGAHHFLAAADIVLLPSLFEPCGLVQIYSMAFGAVPIVRPIGGLKDTVICYSEKGNRSTGFYMDSFCRESLYNATKKAVDIFRCHPDIWERIQSNAMEQDFSWEKNIQHYFDFINEYTKEYYPLD